jgi:hypothetical protein
MNENCIALNSMGYGVIKLIKKERFLMLTNSLTEAKQET